MAVGHRSHQVRHGDQGQAPRAARHGAPPGRWPRSRAEPRASSATMGPGRLEMALSIRAHSRTAAWHAIRFGRSPCLRRSLAMSPARPTPGRWPPSSAATSRNSRSASQSRRNARSQDTSSTSCAPSPSAAISPVGSCTSSARSATRTGSSRSCVAAGCARRVVAGRWPSALPGWWTESCIPERAGANMSSRSPRLWPSDCAFVPPWRARSRGSACECSSNTKRRGQTHRPGARPDRALSVVWVQRFSDGAGAWLHLHVLAPDGLFRQLPDALDVPFEPQPPPSPQEVGALVRTIATRVDGLLRRRAPAAPDDPLLERCAAQQPVALREPTPPPARTKNKNPLRAQYAEFTLHAATSSPPH